MSGQKHKAPEPFPLSLSVAAIPIADDGSSEDGDDGKVGTVAKPLDDGDDDAVDAVVYPNEASGGSPLQEQQRQRRPGDIIDAVLQDRVTNHVAAAHMRNILQHHDETNNNNNNDDDDDTSEDSSAIEADDRNANLLFLRMVGESEEEDNSDGEGSLNEEELEAEVEILNNISNTIQRLRRDNKRLRREHEAIRRDCDELRRQILYDNRGSEDIAALRAAVAPRVQMPLRISHVVAPTNDDDDDEDEDEPKVAASTSAVSTTQPVAGQAPDKERKASTTATGTETETRNSDDDGGDGDGDAPVGSVKPAHANR